MVIHNLYLFMFPLKLFVVLYMPTVVLYVFHLHAVDPRSHIWSAWLCIAIPMTINQLKYRVAGTL